MYMTLVITDLSKLRNLQNFQKTKHSSVKQTVVIAKKFKAKIKRLTNDIAVNLKVLKRN